MDFLSLFRPMNPNVNSAEIPELFPLLLKCEEFVRIDIINTYLKILTDTIERTHGLPEKIQDVLWDNCLESEGPQGQYGLIHMLAEAMAYKRELFLVYSKSVNVLRRATPEEESQIRSDYETNRESPIGVWISFQRYRRTDMLLIYSNFEYLVLSSLNKSLNIAKALQFKIKDLHGSIALTDAAAALSQGKDLAAALRNGNDVLLDKEDEVITSAPQMDATEKSIEFLDCKRAFYLNLPLSYISGEQTPGIGSTGEADMRAVERGLKQYFVSIIKPTIKALFGANVEFKSQDFRLSDTGVKALQAFDTASDRIISLEGKQSITARLFDLDPDQEQKALKNEKAQREKEAQDNTPKLPSGRGGAIQNNRGANGNGQGDAAANGGQA